MRTVRGTDFTFCKQTTIRRRILRRMVINKKNDPGAYLDFLKSNKAELQLLYQDMLIPVTEFFRDSKVFENLCEAVFPLLLKNKEPNQDIRVWIAGCSTGQEAYSMAICIKDLLGDSPQKLLTFATDISEPAITKARAGIYTQAEITTLDTLRLNEFFIKTKDQYQLKKEIREMCVFAVHDFLKDPPFGKIDFISCRNVMIYMEPYLQKKALTTFHYALNDNGFLLLGKSETAAGVPELFAISEKSDKLFSPKNVKGKFMHLATQRTEQSIGKSNPHYKNENPQADFKKIADGIILNKYSPVGVVVNENMDIVEFRGNTSYFLEQSPGEPSHNLLKMARHGLAFEIRNLLHKANKTNTTISKEHILQREDKIQHNITIDVVPLQGTVEPYFLVLFHQQNKVPDSKTQIPKKVSSKLKKDAKDLQILSLEHDLEQSRKDMRIIIEDQEGANMELQSANEELLSSSEELQSLKEELETSKEEMQSTNEELMVVNQEISSLNELVTTAKDYAEAIVSTIGEPLVVMDKSLRIKSANSAFYKTFLANEQETEGVLIYNLGNKQWNIPALRLKLQEMLEQKTTITDFEVEHTFPRIGERVMLLNAKEVIKDSVTEKMILLSMKDITEQKRHQQIEKDVLLRFQKMVMQAPVAICILKGKDYVVELANDAYLSMVEKGKEFLNKPLFETLHELKDQGIKELLDAVMRTGVPHYASDCKFIFERKIKGEMGYFNFTYQPLINDDQKISGVIVTATETTAQVVAKNKVEELQQKYTKELKATVKQQTEELSTANKSLTTKNEELQKVNLELESFSYISSHDLQEPLRKVTIYTDLLLQKENIALSDTGKDYFKKIQKCVRQMQGLIKDLLSYSETTNMEMKFVKQDLNKIIGEVMDELAEIIVEKNVLVEVGILGEANVNFFQMKQAISNLVTNSIKFFKPGTRSHIWITSRLATGAQCQEENPSLQQKKLAERKLYTHIRLSDNGIGFSPDYKDKIFVVFQRLHSKSEYIGTGIGLAIVKKIIENHNGFITATGKENVGATFDIYLPS